MKVHDKEVYVTWVDLLFGFFQIVMAGFLLVNSLFSPFTFFLIECIGLGALILIFPTDPNRLKEEDIKALFYYFTFLSINAFLGGIGYLWGLWE